LGIGKVCEHGLKGCSVALVRSFLGPGLRPAADCRLESLEHVLVVRQDRRLGNLVLITPLLQGLRRAAPHAEIIVVAPRSFAPVLDGHPAVDRIIAIDHRRFFSHPWELASWSSELRAVRPQLAIDASPHHATSFLNGAITRLSGAEVRLGFDRPDADAFLTALVPIPAGAAALHESMSLHDLLRALQPDLPPAPRPTVVAPAGSAAFTARTYQRMGIPAGSTIVGLHPGGRRQKRWATERFAAVASELARRGLEVVVFSGPAERPLLPLMPPPGPHLIYAPPTDVRGLATFLSGLSVFVSGDMGPMHLASALGIPCVTVFRVGDAARYRPLGPRDRVLDGSLREITPADVIAAVEEVGAPAT
jgi:ADP-heptose:LPS heptosyltransferase